MAPPPTGSSGSCGPWSGSPRDRAPHRGPASSGLGVGAAAPSPRLERAAPRRRAAERDQAAIDRWVKQRWPRIQANAQRRRACLVFFDESALSLTPNMRRTWAPRGQTPTLTHPFNWKKASMAAAICYGVRGGGAQLAFHITARQLRHRHPHRGPGRAAPVPRRREGHPAVGRPAVPPQQRHAGLVGTPSGPGWWSSACPPTPRS